MMTWTAIELLMADRSSLLLNFSALPIERVPPPAPSPAQPASGAERALTGPEVALLAAEAILDARALATEAGGEQAGAAPPLRR